MNFGDRERVIMPNGNGSSAQRRRERPNSKPSLNSQDPYAVALCIDTLDPFDEVIRLSDLPSARVEVAPVEAVTEMVDPRDLAALIRAEARHGSESRVDEVPVAGAEAAVAVDTVDSRELADRIRAEARRWSESYVDEADQRATQQVAEQRVAEHPGVVGVAEIAAVADTVDSREVAERIRLEAKRWSESHLAQADQIATQRLLEAEFAARQIVEQARTGTKRLYAEPQLVEPEAPTPELVAEQDEPEPLPDAKRRLLTRPLAVIAAVVLVLAIVAGSMLIRRYVAQPFTVESSSMEPALHQGDRLLVNKVAYHLGNVARGDVVVIDSGQIPGASPELSKTLVKRVVGLPLERVSALDGRLFIDGSPIDQPWLGDVETPDFGPVVIPPGSFYVLGDNRSSSIDSRNFGAVPTDAIIGRVEGVIWPLNDVGRV